MSLQESPDFSRGECQHQSKQFLIGSSKYEREGAGIASSFQSFPGHRQVVALPIRCEKFGIPRHSPPNFPLPKMSARRAIFS